MTDENIRKYIERYVKIKNLKQKWNDGKTYKDEYKSEIFNIINNLYVIPQVKELDNIFNIFNTCIEWENEELSFDDIEEIKNDISRIFEFKKILNEETNFPIISINPTIIDFEKYKKSKEEELKDRLFVRSGNFEVLDVQKNIIEVKENEILNSDKNKITFDINIKSKNTKNKIGNVESFYQDTIKVILKNDVSKIIRKGDKIKMIVSRKLFMVYWNISKIFKCVPSGLEN